MPVIELADRPDRSEAVPVAEPAPERVAGVRRIGDHAAFAHDLSDLDDSALLGVGRVDVEIPGHAMSLGASPAVRHCSSSASVAHRPDSVWLAVWPAMINARLPPS